MGYKQLIYIVGHGRGGTTWLGDLVALNPQVRYIFEPFASQAHPFTGIDTQSLINGFRSYKPMKKRVEIEYPTQHLFHMDQNDDEYDQYVPFLKHHIDALSKHYFNDAEEYTLVLKQPRIENALWVKHSIQADNLVFINRHPLGILGSFERSNVWHWTEKIYPLALKSIAGDYPQYADLLHAPKTKYQRQLVLSYIRTEIMRLNRDKITHWLEYEDLVQDTRGELRLLFDAVNIEWTDAFETIFSDYVSKLKKLDVTDGTGMHSTKKNPVGYDYRWRTILSVSTIEEISDFIEDHNLAITYPGNGLPPLSDEEKLMSKQNDFKRKLTSSWNDVKHTLKSTIAKFTSI